MFDAIYPMVSHAAYFEESVQTLPLEMYETLKVVKDGKMSFIKSDGSYYSNELMYYVDAFILNDKVWFVSDDGINYRTVDINGNIISNGFTNIRSEKNRGSLTIKELENIFVIQNGKTLYLVNSAGKLFYQLNYEEYAYVLDMDVERIYIKSDSAMFAVKYDGTVVYTLTENIEDVTVYAENGFALIEHPQKDIENRECYSVIDVKNGKSLLKDIVSPIVGGNIIIYYNAGTEKYSASSYRAHLWTFDGSIIIDDFYNTIYEVNKRMGSGSEFAEYLKIKDDRVIFSYNSKTAVLKKEDGFKAEKAIILNGYNYLSKYFDETGYLFLRDEFIISSSEKVEYIYDVDGRLICDFNALEDDITYSVEDIIYHTTKVGYGTIKTIVPEVICIVSGVNNDGKLIGYRLLMRDGSLSEFYRSIRPLLAGTYLEVIDDNDGVLLDYNLNEVFRLKNESGYIIDNNNNYYVREKGIYNAMGNLIFEFPDPWTDVGGYGKKGGYFANEYDSSNFFIYYNYVLDNGLCILAYDHYISYGVIKIGGLIEQKTDGLQYDEADEEWYYYVNGTIATDYTGLVEYYGAWYYIENGVLDWYYTGLTEYYGTWYYVEDGVLNWNYTGLVDHEDEYYYVENGVLKSDYTGLALCQDLWLYVENGVINWDYTGLTLYYDTWYYVEDGALNWNYTGLTEYYGAWYYVENGILNWDYSGLTNYNDVWYYVENGVLNWNYTGLTLYYDTWYYVENGVLNWNYTGLTCYCATWYYVENGVLNWDYTGLTCYCGSWYYVENGVLNWSYTGLVYYFGTWYYVGNGVLDWNFTGNVYQYGTWWYVENGIMIGEVKIG